MLSSIQPISITQNAKQKLYQTRHEGKVWYINVIKKGINIPKHEWEIEINPIKTKKRKSFLQSQ